MLNSLFEKTARGSGVSESGVAEHKGGTERDTVWKPAVEKRRGVGLLGLVKGSGARAESNQVRVGVSTCCRVSTQSENVDLGLFRFAREC